MSSNTTRNRAGGAPDVQCDSAQGFEITAAGMLATARAAMDEYAVEIFDLWFNGRAPTEVTFDSPKWASYMRAEKSLQQQIQYQLSAHAEQIRDKVDSSPGRWQSPFTLRFHAQVGSSHGEYRRGYDVLHGTNKTAGDFVITGRLTAVRPGAPGTAYSVTFDDVAFVFNDIVDINKKYAADVRFGQMAANMAKCLRTGPPKDYTLRIKWRAEHPVRIEVKAAVNGQAPGWLRQFPNR